jgi:hypothetical protein
MKWRKLRKIIEANPEISWMSSHAGPTFVKVIDGKVMRVYMSGRDADNVSRIGTVDLDIHDMKTVLQVSAAPVLDVGEPGCFDERGVAYPWLVDDGSRTLLFYAGWIAGGLGGFINAPGVAEALGSQTTFQRVSRAPVMGRTNSEPIGAGSVCVLRENDGWKMWYTSFDRWERNGMAFKHSYCIKFAASPDGINWRRDGVRCIDYCHDAEHAIGKPCVLKRNGRYEMWYSYRGSSYRIGWAVSENGLSWERRDDEAGIGPSHSGWDSEMIEYAHVFEFQDTMFMTYNGNRFGQTGVGLAVLE